MCSRSWSTASRTAGTSDRPRAWRSRYTSWSLPPAEVDPLEAAGTLLPGLTHQFLAVAAVLADDQACPGVSSRTSSAFRAKAVWMAGRSEATTTTSSSAYQYAGRMPWDRAARRHRHGR